MTARAGRDQGRGAGRDQGRDQGRGPARNQGQAATEFELIVDGIPVHVTRKRVKNVNFRVGADGGVRMSVPWHMGRAEAERLATGHAEWLRRTRARVEEKRQASEGPLLWETGERLRVWGGQRTLRVADDGLMPRCELVGDELVLYAPAGYGVMQRADMVERWLASQLRGEVERMAPACEERVGRRPTSITLRRMKTRWGSCTSRTGRIRLNIALAECPRECTRMVLTHELCHLREANHGERFYALMDLCCPDWRVWQHWLDEHPPRA